MMGTTVGNSPHSLHIFLMICVSVVSITGVAELEPLINQLRSGFDYDHCSQVLFGCGSIAVDQCPARISGDTMKDA